MILPTVLLMQQVGWKAIVDAVVGVNREFSSSIHSPENTQPCMVFTRLAPGVARKHQVKGLYLSGSLHYPLLRHYSAATLV